MQLGRITKGCFFDDEVFYRMCMELPFIVEVQAHSSVLAMENARLLRPCAKNCPFHWEFLRSLLAALLEQQAGMILKIECLSQRTTISAIGASVTGFFVAVIGLIAGAGYLLLK